REIVITNRAIRSAEVHGLRENLLLPSTRSDRLIVEAHRWIDLGVGVKPFGINWVWEGRPRPINGHLGRRSRSEAAGQKAGEELARFHFPSPFGKPRCRVKNFDVTIG